MSSAGAPPRVTGCSLSSLHVRFSQLPRGKSEMRQSPQPALQAHGGHVPLPGAELQAGEGQRRARGQRKRSVQGKGRTERAGRRVRAAGGGVASAAATGCGRVRGASAGAAGWKAVPWDRCSTPESAARPGPATASVRKGEWGGEMESDRGGAGRVAQGLGASRRERALLLEPETALTVGGTGQGEGSGCKPAKGRESLGSVGLNRQMP